MPSTTSPNMSLMLPTVGQELGPAWANDLNSSLTTIDQHTHAAGSGVQITPAGINVSSDLAFNINNAISLRSSRYTTQSSALSLGTDLACSYSAGTNGDLYWNDLVGNKIQITASGGVAGTPGSISGLTSPASASYVVANQTFVWQSNVSTAANMDAATLIIRYPGSYPSPAGNFIAIQAPVGLSSGFAITLPPVLPGSQSVVTIDATGQIATPNTYPLPAAGIATAAITTPKISDGNVTRAKLIAVGQQISSTSNTFSTSSTTIVAVTGLSVTITTTGRPVKLALQADGNGSNTSDVQSNSGSSVLRFYRDAASLSVDTFGSTTSVSLYPPGSFGYLDTPGAGTYTYSVYVQVISATGLVVNNCVLVAYEL